MIIKNGVLQLKRNKYIFFNITLWRIRISYFKMGRNCDLRITLKLGKEW